ncbi:GNAT family N-acetyltransferase, partial [Fructobacillus ficulneus]|uniref:GNAT family N-acetyltransferase n=1 Tax=Fructobacillus ficulneus TaxID=157463 RepID=UPI0007849D7A
PAADAPALVAIYKPYVENTAITFEYEVPTVGDFAQRIEQTMTKFPYIVACLGDQILGYAYTGALGPRKAYQWSVETSIYLDQNERGHGLGKRLYQLLEEISRVQNIVNLNACIAVPKVDDQYLTNNSVKFHEHLGFRYVGAFDKSGYKFGTWYDLAWMEKKVQDQPDQPQEIVPFSELLAAGYQIPQV